MYTKPCINENGIHIPLYVDIVEYLIEKAKAIYGDDIYLEIDSQDYQFISGIAEIINDANELAVMIYNNRSPTSAIGPGLDGVVKLNGIRRKGETHSLCAVVLSGEPGTRIYGGIISGPADEKWDIGDVTIPESGKVEVVATCRESGAIFADVGTLTKIVTQTRGWWAVTNQVNAKPGQDIEKDSALRARQAISTANPSRTVLQGIEGAIAAIQDVMRYRAYENDGNLPDENGIPGHSNSIVVEGGKDEEIAYTISRRKTPGSGTYGNVEVQVELSETTLEHPPPIRFFRPEYVDAWVRIEAKPLAGYVTQLAADIEQNVQAYLNSIRIGDHLTLSALYAAVMAATPNISAPAFSVTRLLIGFNENELSTNDMPIRFNQVMRGVPGHVKVQIA